MGIKDIKILIVDDNLTTRRILRKYLNELGYKAIEDADDGLTAWTKISGGNDRYNLVIADWHMPKLSGYELLINARKDPRFKNLPIVLMTGERKKEEIEKAIRAGVTNYILKPFQPDTISAMMAKLNNANAMSDSDAELERQDRLRELEKSKDDKK